MGDQKSSVWYITMKLLILRNQDGTHTNIIQGLNISSLLDDYNYRQQEVFNLQSVQKI